MMIGLNETGWVGGMSPPGARGVFDERGGVRA